MKKIEVRLILAVVVLFLATSACAFLAQATPTPGGPEAIYTQAAQTVSAQLTQAAGSVTQTPGSQPASPTPPPPATAAPTATATLPQPTATTAPTATPTATQVPPTPTPTPIPCNWAQFIEDVTVKDGTEFTPNSVFTKTWKLKNIGLCTWTGDYQLVFSEGDRMEGPRSISFSESVHPGQTVDLSVELVAPEETGRHRGYWMLANDNGTTFGVGSSAKGPFYVEIVVVESDDYVLDFGAAYCTARWRSDSGRLECPGREGDDDGWVQLVNRPLVEEDRRENESALVTSPEDEEDGWIRGEYPEIEVEEDMYFKAVIGCMSDVPDCDVIFQLNYRIDDGEIQTLWEAREVSDDRVNRVDVDLSSLAGEEVEFMLTVLANGDPDDDIAFWLVPRIVEVED